MQKKGEVTEFNPGLICDLYHYTGNLPEGVLAPPLEESLMYIHSKHLCSNKSRNMSRSGRSCQDCHEVKGLDDEFYLSNLGHLMITSGTGLEFLRYYLLSLPLAFPWDETEEGYDYWSGVWSELNEVYEKERRQHENSIEDEEGRSC